METHYHLLPAVWMSLALLCRNINLELSYRLPNHTAVVTGGIGPRGWWYSLCLKDLLSAEHEHQGSVLFCADVTLHISDLLLRGACQALVELPWLLGEWRQQTAFLHSSPSVSSPSALHGAGSLCNGAGLTALAHNPQQVLDHGVCFRPLPHNSFLSSNPSTHTLPPLLTSQTFSLSPLISRL